VFDCVEQFGHRVENVARRGRVRYAARTSFIGHFAVSGYRSGAHDDYFTCTGFIWPGLAGAAWNCRGQGPCVSGLRADRKPCHFATRVFLEARTGSRELFLLMVFALCMGTAYVSYLAGLSLALGAFVAGMVVSDSEYSLQTLSDILPFKDAFLCIFFVSVGMLLDPGFVFSNPEIVLLVLVLGVNAIICTAVVGLFKYPLRVAIFAGAALSQIGEFSFVLAQMGKNLNLIGDYL